MVGMFQRKDAENAEFRKAVSLRSFASAAPLRLVFFRAKNVQGVGFQGLEKRS